MKHKLHYCPSRYKTYDVVNTNMIHILQTAPTVESDGMLDVSDVRRSEENKKQELDRAKDKACEVRNM